MSQSRSRLIVRCVGNYWKVTREGKPGVIASSDTQQTAIEIAKGIAREERGQVEWCDREGLRQGEVDYSPVLSRKRATHFKGGINVTAWARLRFVLHVRTCGLCRASKPCQRAQELYVRATTHKGNSK